MLPKARFVLIDDKQEHLDVLRNAFHQMQTDCHAVIFEPERGIGDLTFPGLRALFTDLHLTSDGASTDRKVNYATILGIIDKIIIPEQGPYVLILWTSHPDDVDGLNVYMNGLGPDALAVNKRPIAVTSLNKNDYFDPSSSAPEVSDAVKFRDDVLAVIRENPQIRALLSWESDVQLASSATLASLVDLVPVELRSHTDFGPALGKILFQLSRAGAGADRAMENPRESINQVLLPVLADRISKHDPEGVSSANWNEALVADADGPSTTLQARMNAALHLAPPIAVDNAVDNAVKRNTELGTVILPSEDPDGVFVSLVGKSVNEILASEFNISKEKHHSKCRLGLVRIGAACDNAQPKPGNSVFMLCMDTETGDHFSAKRKIKDDEWFSPLVALGDTDAPGLLVVKLRYAVGVPESTISGWTARYRLRDSLVNELTQTFTRFISRPGIINVRD